MQVKNVQFYEDMPFEDYLKLPGTSFSGLKSNREIIEPTPKMQFGTAVHNYLLEPEKHKHTSKAVREAALRLKELLAPVLPYCKMELGVTADFIHEGFVLKYKGRIDLCVPGQMVIDLKVTSAPIGRVMEYFNYPAQIRGYALAISAATNFLCYTSNSRPDAGLIRILPSSTYWEEKVLQYGIPI